MRLGWTEYGFADYFFRYHMLVVLRRCKSLIINSASSFLWRTHGAITPIDPRRTKLIRTDVALKIQIYISLERQVVAASGNEPARSFDDSRAGLKLLCKSFRVNFLNFCRNSGMKRSLIDSDAVMMLSVLCLLVRMFVESKSHNMSRGTVGRLHKGQ